MKNIIVLILVLACANVSLGGEIDATVAKNAGKTFLTAKMGLSVQKSMADFRQVYSAVSEAQNTNPITYYYVFNLDSTGFVIVSGIDDVAPILAYSTKGIFDPNDIPPNMAAVLDRYKREISYVVKNQIAATEEAQKQWNELISGKTLTRKSFEPSIEPLLADIKWGQGKIFNDSCPYDLGAGSAYNYKCPTGCVATAMAQIIKYWKYPLRGVGSKCYYANYSDNGFGNYGLQCADFGNTVYNYALMPDTVVVSTITLAEKKAIAQLMYHCGVAVNMKYDTNGSGAYTVLDDYYLNYNDVAGNPYIDARTALKRYFGYSDSIKGIAKDRKSSYYDYANDEWVYTPYPDTEWVYIIKEQLNNRHPVLYAGMSSAGGHAFVCDGYDENDFFHFNWGWNGYYNCYCLLSSLVPEGIGTGGGDGDFSADQNAIINIFPPMTLIDTTVCGEVFVYNDSTYTESGVYEYGFTTSLGDSTVILKLTMYKPLGEIGDIQGDTVILKAGTYTYFISPVENAVSYKWSISNYNWTISGSGTQIFLNVANAGTGTLSVKAMSGNKVCDNKEKNIQIQSTIVGISEYNNEKNIQIYPNPTTGKLIIASPNPSKGGELPTIEIYNVVGQKVNYQLSTVNYQLSIDISHLANGMYFLKVDGKMFKVVKE